MKWISIKDAITSHNIKVIARFKDNRFINDRLIIGRFGEYKICGHDAPMFIPDMCVCKDHYYSEDIISWIPLSELLNEVE